MRILQLIQKSQLRGAEIFASQLSNQLLQMGHEVQLISLLPGVAELPFKGKHVPLDRPLGKRFIDIDGWKLLARHIREFKPDIVQANAGDTLKFAVFSKILFGWKSPIVFRNANKVSDFIDTRPKLIFNKFLMNRVSHVISVSELCRQDFIKTYSFKEKKTTTVPIGIELTPVDTTVPDDLQYIFTSSKTLVNVASFVPEKNHQGLLRIVRSLIDKGEHVKVILIGDGKLRAAIQNQIIEMKLEGHVFLTGYRRDVFSVIANAHAFILPSKIEGLPGVILEAMFCRTPVIAYDVGGVSEIIKPQETGWLVQSSDEEGFVKAVQNVLHSDNKMVRENAYNLVMNKFDNRVVTRLFLEVYQKL